VADDVKKSTYKYMYRYDNYNLMIILRKLQDIFVHSAFLLKAHISAIKMALFNLGAA
jgi:hypothetical protein